MTNVDMPGVERRLTAVLSADVAGYSRLMGDDEEATVRTLTSHRACLVASVSAHRGRVVDSVGDNLLAEFASVVEALRCAAEVQVELAVRNAELPPARRMAFRIGINVGDVLVEGERIYGDGVNIAARLEALAEPGGICVSGGAFEQVETRLAALGLHHEALGEQRVKNISRPIVAYRLALDGVDAGSGGDVARARLEPALPGQQAAGGEQPSIAVLPFVEPSGDPEQAWFSRGISEDLITDLSKLSGLLVISRNSSFRYGGEAREPARIGRELGVRYLLEGSVRRAGTRVRVSAQLTDAETGYQLWAERYDRELEDIFAVQDDVARHIVAALEVKLTQGEHRRIGQSPTRNIEAYEFFLRGLEAYARRTPETNALAKSLLSRAIDLDPAFAAAYARLGRVYMTERMFQWSTDDDLLERAEDLAGQAIALDPALPGAHQTLAYVRLVARRFDDATAHARRAVALDPNDADARVTLSEVLCCAGEPAEALEQAELALRLNPHYPPSYLFALAQAYQLLGRNGEGIEACRRMIVRQPDHSRAHFLMALMLFETGRLDEARAALEESHRLNPEYTVGRMRDQVPYRDRAISRRWVQIVRALEERKD